ncbi:MAG: hypothetical protein PHE33_01525 [Bacteroidales bacterium]|nr:hypothetical protein [Bacteroidales bacterium]
MAAKSIAIKTIPKYLPSIGIFSILTVLIENPSIPSVSFGAKGSSSFTMKAAIILHIKTEKPCDDACLIIT